MKDNTTLLPDGKEFAFWEKETVYTRELHVDTNAVNASDSNDGSAEHPLKTIAAAARLAKPKTRVLIHSGIYRETVAPEAGGDAPDAMISYEGFGDGETVIKASEKAEHFEKSSGWNIRRGNSGEIGDVKVWQTAVIYDKCTGYNPFCAINMPHDREYVDYKTIDMDACLNRRGMVFVDGKPMKQVSLYAHLAREDNTYWVEANGLVVHFRLKGDADPKEHVIELSCREQCFAPAKEFLSYIHVSGLTLAHASMGAPVPQKGALSCRRGHHWVIEDCVIDWANALGIDCGNECWNRSYEEGRILGNTVIRRNTIKDVGICGIAAMSSYNMLIEDNYISGTGWQGMELAWESGGIKLHGANDALMRRNIIRDCYRCDGLWLDFNNRNNRVTGNLFLDGTEIREHIFLECNRDYENMVDNNILWNAEGRYKKGEPPAVIGSESWDSDIDNALVTGHGIYMEGNDEARIVNNLIGNCAGTGIYGRAFSFRIAMGRGGTNRDNMVYNNIFYNCAEAAIKFPTQHNDAEGNSYAKMRPQGGYLRVLYPAPVMCLDLKTWQRFFGFDLRGTVDVMDITVDSEKLTMTMKLEKTLVQHDCEGKEITGCDFYGSETPCVRNAGPFAGLKEGEIVLSLDPRRKK